MQYRNFCGEEISVFGFGAMRLPTKGMKIDREKATELIKYAINNGVNYIDTAWPYHGGESEKFLGDCILNTELREKVNIADKLPCFLINSKGKFDDYLTKQLERLKVDYIDYYLMHSLNGPIWDKMQSFDILEFIEKIKKEKKVRKVGFSFHGLYEDFEKIIDAYDWDFVQIQYNLLDENFQAGAKGIEYATSKNIPVVIMEPLRGGSLANVPNEIKDIYNKYDKNITPAQWAFKWIYNNPNVSVVLSGVNNMEHLKENIEIASKVKANSLSDEELNTLDEAKETYRKMFKVGCTECEYCMPCPVGINIPLAFKSLNGYNMFKENKQAIRFIYLTDVAIATKDGKAHYAPSCIDCGKCEKHCPQDLKIREHLKEVHKQLEPPLLRGISYVARKLSKAKK